MAFVLFLMSSISYVPPEPPLGFINLHWRAIVPPSLSTSHPTVHLPNVPLTPPHPADRSPSSARSASQSTRSNVSTSATLVTAGEDETPLDHAKNGTRLDRFATAYVPHWLQTLPPPTFTATIPPSPPFPPLGYNPSLLSPIVEVGSIPLATIHPSILSLPCPVSHLGPLESTKAVSNPTYYAEHFSVLLSLHLRQQTIEMDQALIYNVPLHVSPRSDHIYRIHIPGIREDTPRLAIGDRLLFRGLYLDWKAPSLAAVEGEIVGMIKSQGYVFVRSPNLEELDKSLPRLNTPTVRIETPTIDAGSGHSASPERGVDARPACFQIRFLVNSSAACVMQDAVRTLSYALRNEHTASRKWLFPIVSDVPQEPATPRDLAWVDADLNEQQKDAVSAVVNRRHRVPFLVSGPPGTGKTKTLVESVHQILLTNPYASVLVCAPSNPAADTIARRLAKHMAPGDMLRLNAPNRTFAEVPDDLLLHSYIQDSAFALPPVQQLLRYRVVVTTCLDANILNEAKVNNWNMMGMECEVHKALHPRSHNVHPMFPHWTHLLIDEAAQASEPEALVPISVVLPYPIHVDCPMIDITVVLCGDVYQLGPVISSQEAREAGLDMSLLERLSEREVYKNHPLSRKNLHKRGLEVDYPAPFVNLLQNYRSIASILMVPAALFYEDSLVASAQDVRLVKWSQLPNPTIPILFAGCESEEDWIDEGASWYNTGEIDRTLALVQSILVEIPEITQKEIAVITPWREQVWKMRAALRTAGYGGVDVGNVETYQGGEFRVTIVSCVRSRERFLESDKNANMGLFNEPKRFNVAITRAKELLVIVGNANLLKLDPYWNGFLQIALRNNLYVGPPVQLVRTEAYLSRIEWAVSSFMSSCLAGLADALRAQLRSERGMDVEDQTMFLSDAVARQTLRDE
ncbi:P-loop containing nucleoside triphosphate hydrolase protein [Papiliotrema laurentii]|uniref:P-loop containing nucleoside triphosphate hydrolase protein n=1 Tax=Papiliotrema laurentii TaxID=5418 RepID=A0AAD9FQ81_PAPLA|nr:P-loop containing nucleoside triphosphate hydrolase protein [Papiliotrema laurentii]